VRLSLPTNDENPIYPYPLPLAGEGRGEAEAEGDPLASGYNTMFPLTAAFPASGSRIPYFYIGERERHPDFSDLCKASLSAFIEILMRGCRCATERDFILSPMGERKQSIF